MNTKTDIIQWLLSYLPEDNDYLEQSAAGYIKEIRELEALLRPLWGVISMDMSHSGTPETRGYILRLKDKLATQTLPDINTNNRQIAVEMAVLAYGVGLGGADFIDNFSKEEREYLFQWMNAVNDIEFPVGNWYFMSVLINTALKVAGEPYHEQELREKQATIEKMYLGEGWYSDGFNQQRDYYVAFAFHFYGLLYSMMVDDEQAQLYKARAGLFAKDFIRWFDPVGRSLPYGRSLTYRFAHVAFWSALVVSGAYKETDFTLGEIKGIIFRNFRWWQKQSISLPKEKNLSIGYGYNNLVLSEDYNAPGSPMWAFKAFILLSLPEDHPFWQVEEEAYPMIAGLSYQQHSGFILCGDAQSRHHVALSGKQFSNNPLLLHHREKYGKFAYSTYFGFNLNRDAGGIEQMAADSTLSLSIAGVDQFAARDRIEKCSYKFGCLYSEWEVPNIADICTILVPINEDCHVRIHRIHSKFELDAYDGGFPLFNWNRKYNRALVDDTSVMLKNEGGISFIGNLLGEGTPNVIPQNPNSNIYHPEKNAVPSIYFRLPKGESLIATCVFASPDAAAKLFSVEFFEKEQYYSLTINGIHKQIEKEQFYDDK